MEHELNLHAFLFHYVPVKHLVRCELHPCLENQLKNHPQGNVCNPSVLCWSHWLRLITWLQHLKCSLSPKPSLILLSHAPFFCLSGKMPERCSELCALLPVLVIWQQTERVPNNWNSIYTSVWHWRRARNVCVRLEWKGRKKKCSSQVPGIDITTWRAEDAVG